MHYRVRHDIFKLIIENLGRELLRYHGGGKERHSPQKQIIVQLSSMANKDSMRQIGMYFRVGTTSVHATLYSDNYVPPLQQNIHWCKGLFV